MATQVCVRHFWLCLLGAMMMSELEFTSGGGDVSLFDELFGDSAGNTTFGLVTARHEELRQV